MTSYQLVIIFAVLWVVTFFPAWALLIKLVAWSASKKRIDLKFITLFILYRVVIILPYLVFFFVDNDLPGIVKTLILGFIIFGVILSLARFFLRDYLEAILWNIYSRVYDGLMNFYPYKHLINRVVEVSSPKNSETILDLGCGTGNISRILAEKETNLEIYSIDTSAGMVQIAKKKLKKYPNVRVYHSSLSQFVSKNPGLKFDKIIVSNVLYAVDDREKFWTDVLSILKTDGHITLTNSDKGGSLPIVREHLRNDSIFKLLSPKLLVVFFVDYFISQLADVGKFSFISKSTIIDEVEAGGGKAYDFERCYGGHKDGVNLLFKVSL